MGEEDAEDNGENNQNSDEFDNIKQNKSISNHNDSELKKEIDSNIVLERLKSLYIKLWLSLRSTVRIAFQSYTDVLEAGTYIQNIMDVLMKGKMPKNAEGDILETLDLGLGISDDGCLRRIFLNQGERLQVCTCTVRPLHYVSLLSNYLMRNNSCLL